MERKFSEVRRALGRVRGDSEAHSGTAGAGHAISVAAALQILSTVRTLEAFSDLRELIGSRNCADAARELFPRYAGSLPRFLPGDWLTSVARA